MRLETDYNRLAPDSVKALIAFEKTLADSPIGMGVIHLVKIRASQINGCLFCLDMHVKEALLHGERPLRLHHLSVWHESPLFDPRERAALRWTEVVTKLSTGGISEEEFAKARAVLSEKELADLTLAIGAINIWNRLSVAFLPAPGSLDKIYGLDKAGLS